MRERLRRTWQPFKLSPNLVITAIAVPAGLLTLDWWLLGIYAALEILYLIAAPSMPSVMNRDESLDPLDIALMVVLVSGSVVILIFGFGKHLLTRLWPGLTHAQGWEIGAIIWTGISLIYYFCKVRTGNSRIDKGINACVFLACTPLLFGAALTLTKPQWHLICILAISILLLVTDYAISRYHYLEKEQWLSRQSVLFADIPAVTAFLVLLIFMSAHRDAENTEAFLGGAISLQLIMSNAMFVIQEFRQYEALVGRAASGR
jgi:hypothetical protein